MPNTHDIGRLFWHLQRYPRHVPYRPVEKATIGEIEPPFRTAKGVAFRVLWRGAVVGWWSDPTNDYDSVPPGMEVLGDRTEEVRDWTRPESVSDLPSDRWREIYSVEREL